MGNDKTHSDQKRNLKVKKSKKSKKNRKSDPIVNDISSLLSTSLNLVSPNNTFNTENCKNDAKRKKRKRSSKSISPNVSSNSLDAFVIRTPTKTNDSKLSKISLPDDDFESKENINKSKEKTKNAFQFMMDSRNKSIGTNSPGKELKIKDNTPKDKDKLSARKSLLQNWADKKGGIKRKNEEVERDECITFKLEERAKRLKKLLNVSDTLDIHHNKKKLEQNETDDDDIHVYDSDKEKPQETLKIKMFSPQVFKKKKLKDKKLIKTKIYSDNSDASNDSDTFPLRRRTRKRVKFPSVSENGDSNDLIIDVEENRKRKNPTKVAPVFLLSTPKPKLDTEALEAKKKFLNSGIPNALKKAIEKEKVYDLDFDVFPKISHVQQKTSYNESIDFWNLSKVELNFKPPENPAPEIKILRGSIMNLTENKVDIKLTLPKKVTNTKEILQKIKKNNPDYPVFKCFRLLNEKAKVFEQKAGRKKRRRSKEESAPNYEMWTEKYKVTSHEDIIGNNKRVLELKKWLENWLEFTNVVQNKNNKKSYVSDSEFDLDSSSYDSMQGLCNAMILTGPHGCGKSMSVYMLCNELGINVIELNASSKRTGKRLLQELQEATQSHQVRKNETLSTFISTKKEINDRKLCLLLIEDLDIIFEQDDGFLNALSQLLVTSKRPIIITTTDINCNYLQKFILQYPVINFSALSSKVLSVWLQIVCLLEGIITNSDDLGQLLEFYNGDARRTLLQLQLFVQTGGSLYTDTKEEISENQNKVESVRDEELNISFFNGAIAGKNLIHKNSIYNFIDRYCLVHDFNLEKVWWNLPSVLDTEISLEKYKNLSDAVSVVDVIYTKSNIFERHSNSIDNQSFLKDSVELKERYDSYKSAEFIKNWSEAVLNSSINSYGEVGRFELDKPTSGQKRWLKKQKDCSEKFAQLVPCSYHSDRRNYALDYFPTLRAICRSETYRASVNAKRKNRFYNYLRAFDFKCSDSMNETACGIFSVNGDKEL